MKKHLIIVALFLLALLPVPSFAVVFGGMNTYGWELDFDKVTPEQKKLYKWFDDVVKINFRKRTMVLSAPGISEWNITIKPIVLHQHEGGGPTLFLIHELFDKSTIEEVKKTQYLFMSGQKGFREGGCIKLEKGAQTCEVTLAADPNEVFYAAFYEWKVAERNFVLVVRNAQRKPDRKAVEDAAKVLISLIKIK